MTMPSNSASAPPASAPHRTPERVRHPLQWRLLSVLRAEHLTPHLVRVTLTGPELQGFNSPGFDDHLKLVLPDPSSGQLVLPTMGADGPQFPTGARPVMRDYTPRRFDAAAQTLDIDFALHEAGPATQWAAQAAPGQQVAVGGPRGSFIIPTAFDGHLLIGDDTALPAIARRLQELPAGAPAVVLAEVDSAADELAFDSAADVSITWVHRRGAEPGTQALLLDALKTLRLPPGDFHTWVACETSAAKALRGALIAEHGARAAWTKAAGYWRRGAVATHDTHTD